MPPSELVLLSSSDASSLLATNQSRPEALTEALWPPWEWAEPWFMLSALALTALATSCFCLAIYCCFCAPSRQPERNGSEEPPKEVLVQQLARDSHASPHATPPAWIQAASPLAYSGGESRTATRPQLALGYNGYDGSPPWRTDVVRSPPRTTPPSMRSSYASQEAEQHMQAAVTSACHAAMTQAAAGVRDATMRAELVRDAALRLAEANKTLAEASHVEISLVEDQGYDQGASSTAASAAPWWVQSPPEEEQRGPYAQPACLPREYLAAGSSTRVFRATSHH